ncbi:hypothetical protein [Thalassobacillus sp. CUG 92003]|uniref:hypothetical protein n=1 Tax=Thalassobacillus sp. CUG 92003 TaxID=2736641 RepID=UPI0015E72D4A|nr:hypothetical protein [Thalassobacillus sp. CUG 92003]
MHISTSLKWITGIFEALLAIPLVGGIFIIGTGWNALIFMLIFHIITLVFSIRDDRFSVGSVLGVIASLIGLIPVIGWIMHTLTAIVLLIDALISTGVSKNRA